jgi:hypothetical protein
MNNEADPFVPPVMNGYHIGKKKHLEPCTFDTTVRINRVWRPVTVLFYNEHIHEWYRRQQASAVARVRKRRKRGGREARPGMYDWPVLSRKRPIPRTARARQVKARSYKANMDVHTQREVLKARLRYIADLRDLGLSFGVIGSIIHVSTARAQSLYNQHIRLGRDPWRVTEQSDTNLRSRRETYITRAWHNKTGEFAVDARGRDRPPLTVRQRRKLQLETASVPLPK